MVGVLVIDMRKLSYPPIWILFEQGRAQVAAEPHSLSALTVAVALPAGRTLRCRMRARIDAYGCRGLVRGRAPATSGLFRRKWAPISPWVLDFCAVFGGSRSLPASPTWGNADAAWRFGLIRPAKPSRSCKRGSLALKVAHLNVCFDLVGAGRHPRMNKAFETRWRPEVSKIEINTHIKLTSVSRYYKVTAG